jgi:hypothetical protein
MSEQQHPKYREHRSFLASRGGFVMFGFLALIGTLMFTEHRAHTLGALPYLILLACPLMHLFMHHGHGHHHDGKPLPQADHTPGEGENR